jgi:general secretion pathway protein L
LDQVYYDGRVLARDRPGRTVDVELSVAPRAIVDEALAALQTVGLHPDRVAVDRAGAAGCPDVNLLTTARRKRRLPVPRTLNLVLAVLALALVAALVGLPLWDRHRTLRALEAELAVADGEARAARELRAELERLSDGAAFLVEKRRATPLVLTVLDEVTRLVPDDTWVNSLRLRDGKIELNGHSDASAALIPILDASPLFGNVRFLSPVTRDRLADDERFHLAADFESEAAR